jgi:hypothetical protein
MVVHNSSKQVTMRVFVRLLRIALSLAPSALANSQCDTACEVATGLVDCGFFRDCENHILDEGGCSCTLQKGWIAIISIFSIGVFLYIAGSFCKSIAKIMGACCGDSDADKLKADMKRDEALADGRLIRDGVGTPRTLHASRSNPACRACGPPCLWCPAKDQSRTCRNGISPRPRLHLGGCNVARLSSEAGAELGRRWRWPCSTRSRV